MVLLDGEVGSEGVFCFLDYVDYVLESDALVLFLLEHEVSAVIEVDIVGDDFIFDQGLDVVEEVLFFDSFGVQGFEQVDDHLLALIDVKVLVGVEQVGTILHIDSIWILQIEGVLGLVSVLAKEQYLAGQKRHHSADVPDLASDLLYGLLGSCLLGGQPNHLLLVFV